jgi:hypothetical protein
MAAWMPAGSSEAIVAIAYLVIVLLFVIIVTWKKISLFRQRGRWRDNRRHVHRIDQSYGLFRVHNLSKRALIYAWLLGMALLAVNALIFSSTVAKLALNPILNMAAQSTIVGVAVLYVSVNYGKGGLRRTFRRMRIFFIPLLAAAGLAQFLNTFAAGTVAIVKMF